MNDDVNSLREELDVLRSVRRLWHGVDKLEDEHPHIQDILPSALKLIRKIMNVPVVGVTYIDHFGRLMDYFSGSMKTNKAAINQLKEINRKILETSNRYRKSTSDGYCFAVPLIPYKQKLVGALGVYSAEPLDTRYESILDDAAMQINTMIFRANQIVAAETENLLIDELDEIIGLDHTQENKRREILKSVVNHTDSRLGYWLHVKKGMQPSAKNIESDHLELLYSWGVEDVDVSELKFSDVVKKAVRAIKTDNKSEVYRSGKGELKYALACELKLSKLDLIGGAIILFSSYPYNDVRRQFGEEAVKKIDDFVILSDENLRLLEEKELVKDIFGGMVGPDLMDMIVKTRGSLGHTSRFIAMMVADISGTTAAAEAASNAWIKVENMVADGKKTDNDMAFMLEQAVEQTTKFATRLNEYLMIPAQSIIDHNGSIDKYIGDAVFGVWGAPTDQKDIVFKALLAAWEAKKQVDEFNKSLCAANEPTFDIKFVLNCGRAIAGLYGCPSRPTYTVISDSVNTLFRVEKFARGGEIIMTEDFYENVKEKVKVEMVGERGLKGKSKKVKLYKLLSIKGRR